MQQNKFSHPCQHFILYVVVPVCMKLYESGFVFLENIISPLIHWEFYTCIRCIYLEEVLGCYLSYSYCCYKQMLDERQVKGRKFGGDYSLRRSDSHSGKCRQQECETRDCEVSIARKQITNGKWSWSNKLQRPTSGVSVSSSKAPGRFHMLSEQGPQLGVSFSNTCAYGVCDTLAPNSYDLVKCTHSINKLLVRELTPLLTPTLVFLPWNQNVLEAMQDRHARNFALYFISHFLLLYG